MTTYTHQTAPTQFVEANGIRFAYRRFGKATGVPIVFNQHYTGTMDHWDPAVTDGFAREREVIRFRLRAKDRDPEVNEQVAPAQRAAIAKWAAPRERMPASIPRLVWSGDVPHQKWMNFYTKVPSKFAATSGLRLTLRVEVAPPEGVSPQRVDETKVALRELGLKDSLEG
jgi:hypothetical protein